MPSTEQPLARSCLITCTSLNMASVHNGLRFAPTSQLIRIFCKLSGCSLAPRGVSKKTWIQHVSCQKTLVGCRSQWKEIGCTEKTAQMWRCLPLFQSRISYTVCSPFNVNAGVSHDEGGTRSLWNGQGRNEVTYHSFCRPMNMSSICFAAI